MVISCATTSWKGRVVQFMWLHYGERVGDYIYVYFVGLLIMF